MAYIDVLTQPQLAQADVLLGIKDDEIVQKLNEITLPDNFTLLDASERLKYLQQAPINTVGGFGAPANIKGRITKLDKYYLWEVVQYDESAAAILEEIIEADSKFIYTPDGAATNCILEDDLYQIKNSVENVQSEVASLQTRTRALENTIKIVETGWTDDSYYIGWEATQYINLTTGFYDTTQKKCYYPCLFNEDTVLNAIKNLKITHIKNITRMFIGTDDILVLDGSSNMMCRLHLTDVTTLPVVTNEEIDAIWTNI